MVLCFYDDINLENISGKRCNTFGERIVGSILASSAIFAPYKTFLHALVAQMKRLQVTGSLLTCLSPSWVSEKNYQKQNLAHSILVVSLCTFELTQISGAGDL